MSSSAHDNWESGPLAGAVICCTSLDPEQKTRVNDIVPQLGARHSLDLTADTTHLLVGSLDTPKYRYVARERKDVKVLKPDFLEAVRLSWMQGDDADLNALEAEYRLPTFSGLNVCVTGFDNSWFLDELNDCFNLSLTIELVQQRMGLVKAFEENGAVYHGDLTRIVSHLVCSVAEGKKYQFARAWGVKVVSLEWVRDSIGRGMILDESLYDPTLPADQRGIGAITTKRPASPGTKRTQLEASISKPREGGKRKLRRTASAKYETKTDNDIWADMASGGADATGPTTSDWNEAPQVQQRRTFENAPSVSNGSEGDISQKVALLQQAPQPSQDRPFDPRAIFSRMNFLLHHGFEKPKLETLRSCLEGQGGRVFTRENEAKEALDQNSIDTLITISTENIEHTEVTRLESQGLVSQTCPIKTFFWIEHCLYAKRVLPLDTSLCSPFPVFPIDGFEKLTICPTSFKGMELLHFSKAVKLMGARYEESCTPETSLIVGNKGIPNVDKLKYALNHGIPVVDAQWFFECTRLGQLLPIEPYFPSSYAIEFERKRMSIGKLDLQQVGDVERKPSEVGILGETDGVEVSLEDAGQQDEHQQEPTKSQPLRESGTRLNSPPKRAQPVPKRPLTGTENRFHSSPSRQVKQLHADTVHSVSSPVEIEPSGSALNSAIQTLLAQRKAAAGIRNTSQEPPPRRHRKLGRATSNSSSHRAVSIPRAYSETIRLSQDDFPEGRRSLQRQTSEIMNPSQTLTYEDPEALAARRKLLEKMGNSDWADDDDPDLGVRVQSIGTVQDFTTTGELQERTTRRRTRRQ